VIAQILLALDQPTLQTQLKQRLAKPDVLVRVPRARRNLWNRLARETCDMVILSKTLVPRQAVEAIASLGELPDAPALVVFTSKNDPEERAALLAAGAEEVLYSGLSTPILVDVLETLLNKRREIVRQRLNVSRSLGQPRLADFVSNSPVMQDFMEMVRRIVPGNSSLLLLGETGVGKERLARAIHAEGARSDGPFVAVNCGALPESLLESELFGHEEGAFTGATRSRRGCFEMAHRGTIFLDEIAEMPLHLQVRLLRVLQDQQVQRVGGERPITVDVRVMAATNRDLHDEVEAGQFRRDLYYRLGVVSLTVPPLRERVADIAELAVSYVEYLRPRIGADVDSVSAAALAAMERYSWPGNVRELINVVERGMLLAAGGEITCQDLPEEIRRSAPGWPGAGRGVALATDPRAIPDELLEQSLAEARARIVESFERGFLIRLLDDTGGRIGETAGRAGITPRSLYDKMRRYGLRKEDFKRRR